MDEKKIKELLLDLVVNSKHMLDLIDDKALFGNSQECEYFMPVYQSKEYAELEEVVRKALDSVVLDEE